MRAICAALLLSSSAPALGQGSPGVGGDDQRIREIDYSAGGIFHVDASPDTVQTVLFPRGEQIRSVIISDPAAYTITVAGSGDAMSFKPNGANVVALVNVKTDQRDYDLELAANQPGPVPTVIRFTFGNRPRPALSANVAAVRKSEGVSWKISGSKSLQPAEVSDDGLKTYIAWREDQAIPAVFAVGPGPGERMIDGYMRGGYYTIDRVHDQLIFRIDNEVARAQRIRKRGRHERVRDSAPRDAG